MTRTLPLISFDVWVQLPSLNSWQRMHWSKQRSIRLRWHRIIAGHILALGNDQAEQIHRRSFAGERFRLRLTQLLGKGCQAYDGDNFSTASKLIADAFVHLQVFKDDSLTYLAQPLYGQPIRDKSQPCGGVRVEIIEDQPTN